MEIKQPKRKRKIPEGERPIEQVIGENIKRYFEQQDKSLTAICHEVYHTPSTTQLKKIMAGEANPSTIKLQEMACALGVKTMDLVEDWSEEGE